MVNVIALLLHQAHVFKYWLDLSENNVLEFSDMLFSK